MMQILCLVSYPFLPARTGGQKAISLLYKYLSEHANLICVTTKNNDPNAAPGYEVLNILSDSPFRYVNIFYFFRLRKIIRERKITHLMLEHPYYGWLAVWLKYATGVQVIVRSHNIEGLRWKTLGKWWWRILWRYEAWTHRRADFNFFIQSEDLAYGIRHFRLPEKKCLEVTYGVELDHAPSREEKTAAREQLISLHGIPAGNNILLFNGAFNYTPNLSALKRVLSQINPYLQRQPGFLYTLIICGKDIPATISQEQYPNTIFAGFVDDITLYLKGSDIFLNPITEGGGIKTKLVEALGFDMNAVSFASGALGVDPALCNGKLAVVSDADSDQFGSAIIQLSNVTRPVPPTFFDHFYWGNIVRKAIGFIEK